jgi:hypothetical protein
MGFLDKAKAAAEQAAAKAKGGVEDVQLKRELGQAFDDLGKQAFELIESGALAHSELEPTVARIRVVKEKLAAAAESTPDEAEAQDSDEPPAAA